MKKLGYLLSIAGHALALLIALNSRFAITIRPEPPREIIVSIAEPPPLLAEPRPAWPQRGGGTGTGAPGRGQGSGSAGAVSGKGAGTVPRTGGLAFPALSGLDLTSGTAGDFRLAPVGKSPEPWAVPIGAAQPRRSLRFGAGAWPPGAATVAAGGGSGVFLVPFDVREKAVAAWTETALSRIERNWFIPASARLAFSGRVQVTLTIEKNGSQRTLAVDDSNLPEALSRSALHAVQASLPLPPLPENVAGETFAFTFVFIYNG